MLLYAISYGFQACSSGVTWPHRCHNSPEYIRCGTDGCWGRDVAGSRCMLGLSACPGGSWWRWRHMCTRAWPPWRAHYWPARPSSTTATPSVTSRSPPSSIPSSSASPRWAPCFPRHPYLAARCKGPADSLLSIFQSVLEIIACYRHAVTGNRQLIMSGCCTLDHV